MVRMFWDYGLDLWKTRNSLVHGNSGDLSNMEKQKIDQMVRATYSDLGPSSSKFTKEFFCLPVTERITQSYKSKQAWLESVWALFPNQFSSLEHSVVGKLLSNLTTVPR